MKELREVFEGRGQVKGFKFTKIKKTEHAYLYRVDTGSSKHYEIFERKENTQFNCVSYPSNKAFGLWAKTTSDYNRALDILELTEAKVVLRKEVSNG